MLLTSQAKCLASASQVAPSVFVRLARVLHDLPLSIRSDFAWLALTQMAEFYYDEAAQARRETGHTSRARDVSQWAAAVDAYAREISTLAYSISPETPISIRVEMNNSVNIYVDGRPVILTEALGGQQSVYEQRIIERFCTLYGCEDLLPNLEYSDHESSVVVLDTDETTVSWSFNQDMGPVCKTDDGLEFQFQKMSDLAQKRVACNQVIAELSALARAITREQRRGVRVDWNGLGVLLEPAGEPQRVILAAGTEIRLRLPLLAENPKLLKIVRSWLRSRILGENLTLVVLNAERLMGLEETPTSRTINLKR
jgi:hypothetical protein